MTTLRSPFTPRFTGADLDALVTALSAIAHQQRLLILRLLHANGEQTVSLLTAQLKIGQPTVTHHVKKLKRAGLVSVRRSGVNSFVNIDARMVAAVASALSPWQAS